MSLPPAVISQTQTDDPPINNDEIIDDRTVDDEMPYNPHLEEVATTLETVTKITRLNQRNQELTMGGLHEAARPKKFVQLTLDGQHAKAGLNRILVKRHLRANPRNRKVVPKEKNAKCVRNRKSITSLKLSVPKKMITTNEDHLSAKLARTLHIQELTNLFDSIKTK
jgi:hypothetical protein